MSPSVLLCPPVSPSVPLCPLLSPSKSAPQIPAKNRMYVADVKEEPNIGLASNTPLQRGGWQIFTGGNGFNRFRLRPSLNPKI